MDEMNEEERLLKSYIETDKIVRSKDIDFALVKIRDKEIFLTVTDAKLWHIIKSILSEVISKDHRGVEEHIIEECIKEIVYRKGLDFFKMEKINTDDVERIFRKGLLLVGDDVTESIKKVNKQNEDEDKKR